MTTHPVYDEHEQQLASLAEFDNQLAARRPLSHEHDTRRDGTAVPDASSIVPSATSPRASSLYSAI